jgi:hypothetical protein
MNKFWLILQLMEPDNFKKNCPHKMSSHRVSVVLQQDQKI